MKDVLAELKSQRIWVLFQVAKQGKRLMKRPCAANGGPTGSNYDYKDTWVTYPEAVKAQKKQNTDAVGFVIPKGFFFLDIDHRNAEDPFLREIVERFGSYTEYSMSGNGIHIYGKIDFDRLPLYYDKNGTPRLDRTYYMKNPKNQMELYCGGLTNRFAVYTGNTLRNSPLAECTNALLETLEKDMKRPPKVKQSAKNRRVELVPGENDDLIRQLRQQKNGNKFSQLFDKGDATGYGSDSEADAALCTMIAFRVGNDPGRIDEIYRQSALYREKWNRPDYRESTIQFAIDACHGEFHKSTMEHPEFILFDRRGEPVVNVPLLAQHVRDHVHYILVRSQARDKARLFVYEDGVYRQYSTEMMLGKIKQYVADYDPMLVNMNQISQVLQQIVTDRCHHTESELNRDESIINFQNGLLKVSEDELQLTPHSHKTLSTIQIPCAWTGADADTPVFDNYMDTLTNKDSTVKELLLEFMGVCISNVNGSRMKKALFLVGDGDTGKSQLKSLVEQILGHDNFIGVDLTDIESRFGTGAVYGKRLAGSSDMSFMTVGELKTFKKMTGGDSLYAEFKGEQPFEYTYKGLLWFCMNRLPKFGGDDGDWVYKRIMVVNCPNVVPLHLQDKHLLEKMYAERNGIIYKAVKALQQVLKNGYRFSEPESVQVERARYKAENNTVIAFFEDCMIKRQSSRTNDNATVSTIYNVYRAWCKDNNHGYSKTMSEFRNDLSVHLGIPHQELVVHKKAGNYYKDYTLSYETKQTYVREYGYDALEIET